MATIKDYLRWRGDLTFDERPFNDVDNVICATLSYVDFAGIVPAERTGSGISLAYAIGRLLEQATGDVAPYVRSLARIDNELLELLADARRYRDLTLRAYANVTDEARALQFAALQIDLSPHETYVSFRGTDSTLVGWREDFMLSFMVTEAQRMAAEYLARALGRAGEAGRTVRVGGHSKGGNLAEYAAVCCTPEQLERVVRVYSNDGPGMAPDVMPEDSRALLGSKLKRIVPSFSVIGMLFARQDDRRLVVASSGVGIGQHDPTTWQVLRSGVQEVRELQPDCAVLNEAIASWAEGVPLDERERVVDEVFDALGAGGATRLDEITATPEGIQQVLRALGETDDRTREIAMTLVECLVSGSVEAVRKATEDVFEQWHRNVRTIADDAVRKLRARTEVRLPQHRLPSGH